MGRILIDALVALAALVFAAAPAAAQDVGPGGKDVYDVACERCHSGGDPGAPKIGDRAAWTKRSAQGIGSLTRHAIDGIRRMPAHGGHVDLGDLELQRAIVYMVNRSGGNWLEPRAAGIPPGELSGAQVVHGQCYQCHQFGYGNAPRIGDHGDWQRYLRLGMDAAVRKVVKGHGDMPARGGRPSLSEAEIRSAIIYMASRSPRR